MDNGDLNFMAIPRESCTPGDLVPLNHDMAAAWFPSILDFGLESTRAKTRAPVLQSSWT